jgi:ABC-2 type transport system ATP-binding protein
MVQEPKLVFLDEPTAGVDPAGSRVIRDLIVSLKERGLTVVLTSHLLEQVQQVCDRVGIMSKGSLKKEGSLDELLALEDQTEINLRNAPPELLEKIRELSKSAGAEVLNMGTSRTTLERLFLEVTGTAPHKEPEYRNSQSRSRNG